MVLSVVNLQEAYAKALLVDRDALAAAQADGDVLAGHELLLDAYKTDVRPQCAEMRALARRGRGPDRRAARLRYVERIVAERGQHRLGGRRLGPMTTLAQMIARAEDRWPDGAESRTTRSGRCCSPRTCSAPTARWRTSAAATRRPRARRPTTSAARSRSCGSRARAATSRRWSASTSRRCGSTRCSPLFERDEMSDEDMVAHLARCQIDPAAPRSLDRDAAARVRAGHARAPHAPRRRSTCSPARATASGWSPSASATRRRGSRTSGPASRSPSRSATAVRENPDLKLVVLAKHGLVVWGDTRRGGVPAHDRGHQPGRRLRQRAHGAARSGSTGRRRRAGRRRADSCARCCPRCAARCRASGRRCSSSTPRRARSSSSPRARRRSWSTSAPPAPTTSCTPSACRCGSRSTRRARTPDDAGERIRERGRARSATTTARTSSATATSPPSRPTPTRASC